MGQGTKRLARLALLTALGAAVLYLAAVLPSAKLATTAVAGVMTAAALMRYGPYWAAGVYAATGLLGLLILPVKDCAVLYVGFFGYYPILKSLMERLRTRLAMWLCKGLVYSAAFFAWWFALKALLLPVAVAWYVAWPVGAAAFWVYDVCLSQLIRFYIHKIAGYLK